MKKLDLGVLPAGKRAEAFAVLWWAFRAGYPKRNTGFEQLKLLNRLGEKLEAFSKQEPTPQDPLNRVLNGKGGGALLLPEMEFDLLKTMLKEGPPAEVGGWTYLAGRTVEQLVEAMEHADTVEVEEVRRKK